MTLNFLNIIHVLLAVALIGFILVQRGPGATAGSAFGSGASGTVFGAKGSGSFLTKTTAILATLFFALSMLMAVQANRDARQMMRSGSDLGVVGSLQDDSEVPAITPAKPAENSADMPAVDAQAMEAAKENAAALKTQAQEGAAAVQKKTSANQADNVADKAKADELSQEPAKTDAGDNNH